MGMGMFPTFAWSHNRLGSISFFFFLVLLVRSLLSNTLPKPTGHLLSMSKKQTA